MIGRLKIRTDGKWGVRKPLCRTCGRPVNFVEIQATDLDHDLKLAMLGVVLCYLPRASFGNGESRFSLNSNFRPAYGR